MNYLWLIVIILLLAVSVVLGVLLADSKAALTDANIKAIDAARVAASSRVSAEQAWAAKKRGDMEISRLKTEVALLKEQLSREEISPQESNDKSPFNIHTNVYSLMDYRKITDIKSDQYILQQEDNVFTAENGIRTLRISNDCFYCAALAGAFGYNIGDSWEVTLKNGYKFGIVLGDYKHPINPNEAERQQDLGDMAANYLGDDALNVIEFIVDMDSVPKKVKKAGTMSALEDFGGLYSYDSDIADMQYIGRIWTKGG